MIAREAPVKTQRDTLTAGLKEVLAGSKIALLRKWVYGVESSPAQIILPAGLFALEQAITPNTGRTRTARPCTCT